MDKILAAERGEYIEGVSDPDAPNWVTEDLTKPKQPEVSNMGNGVFSIDGLMDSQPASSPALSIVDQARQRAAEEKLHPANSGETTSDVQMETAQPVKDENDNAVSASEGTDATAPQADAVNMRDILAERCPDLTAAVLKDQQSATAEEEHEPEPEATKWPEFFEPGRYEGVPNDVYHAANGTSSTQVKDARISLMYFEKRHVSKVIEKMRSPVLDMGNLVHALALQPEQLEKEFSIEPEIPEGAFTTTATIRAFIDEYNAGLPPLLSADDIKAQLEAHNATLPAPVPLGGDKDAIGIAYLELPDEFKRIVGDDKNFTASAMKACIKEYNATLPAPVKTSGGRDALLEQLAIINPDMVAQEAQKAQPLKVSGNKADLIQAVKSVKPDAVFADELLDAWRENPEGKILVTRQQMSTALDIQKALLNHPTAGKLLQHPNRAVEVSYFGIDEETGLEVRVRPDLEIDMSGLRIGADLKTISMWNIKQEGLRAKLHRKSLSVITTSARPCTAKPLLWISSSGFSLTKTRTTTGSPLSRLLKNYLNSACWNTAKQCAPSRTVSTLENGRRRSLKTTPKNLTILMCAVLKRCAYRHKGEQSWKIPTLLQPNSKHQTQFQLATRSLTFRLSVS